MQTFRGRVSEHHHPHIEALLARHARLEQEIEECQKHPSTSDPVLKKLKYEKLRVKDEVAELRRRTG